MSQKLMDISTQVATIGQFGKENLADILHCIGETVPLLTGQSRCRLYLEDLTSGTLVCSLATGQVSPRVHARSFPLTGPDFLVSRVYIVHEEIDVR